jgi:hypothetical protein
VKDGVFGIDLREDSGLPLVEALLVKALDGGCLVAG